LIQSYVRIFYLLLLISVDTSALVKKHFRAFYTRLLLYLIVKDPSIISLKILPTDNKKDSKPFSLISQCLIPYRVTYYRISLWSQSGSNRRPPACKAGALPAELWPLVLLFPIGSCDFFQRDLEIKIKMNLKYDRLRFLFFFLSRIPSLVGLGRLELPTSPLSGVRSNHLSYRPARPFFFYPSNQCGHLSSIGLAYSSYFVRR
jgi:hypothetical protein